MSILDFTKNRPLRSSLRFMARGCLQLSTALALAHNLAGCAAKTETVGGETNWLVACDADADCDSGSCHCGACSETCSAVADCNGLSNATCADSDSNAAAAQCASEPAPQALCLPACSRDSDCAADQHCTGGACVLNAASADPSPSSSGDDPYMPAREVTNPTGDCVATNNGARLGHSPNASDVYLPDCELSLTREYYRVFVQEDDTAYMMPRPDQHPAFYYACNQGDALREALDRYDLCQEEAFSAAQVAAANAMTAEDALLIAHYLHEQLVFVAAADGVSPYPYDDDILAVCETDLGSGVLAEPCAFVEDRANSGREEVGPALNAEQAAALADGLNALYGISSSALCTRLTNSASSAVGRVIEENRGPCTTDEDCSMVANASACHDACGAVVATANVGAVEAASEALSGAQCASFERADCKFIIPPCVPPGPVACIDGLCTEGQ